MKDIIILGGPNGAGKTTTANVLLPNLKIGVREFVNADEIARGLSPFNAEGAAVAAGRLMIERMRAHVREGRSFAFETTCAGSAHAMFIRRCKSDGWRVSLLFLWLPSPKAALARVAHRVQQGGHAIPGEIVIRRYWGGLKNLWRLYLPLADQALIYDNSDEGPVLVVEKTDTGLTVIHDQKRWIKVTKTSP